MGTKIKVNEYTRLNGGKRLCVGEDGEEAETYVSTEWKRGETFLQGADM